MPFPFDYLDDGDTMVGQTLYQLVSALGPVSLDTDATVASGDGSLALGDANLQGTTLINGSVDGPFVNGNATDSIVGDGNVGVTGDDNAVAIGTGNMVGHGDDLNMAHGDVVDVDDSIVSESALGHSLVESNDVSAYAVDGSAINFGSGDATGAGDQDVHNWGDDANIGLVQGEDNTQVQAIDESTHVDVDTTVDASTDNSIHLADAFNTDDSFNTVDSFDTDASSHWDVDVDDSYNHLSSTDIIDSFKAEIDASDDDGIDVA